MMIFSKNIIADSAGLCQTDIVIYLIKNIFLFLKIQNGEFS